jgi:hypothetical protein
MLPRLNRDLGKRSGRTSKSWPIRDNPFLTTPAPGNTHWSMRYGYAHYLWRNRMPPSPPWIQAGFAYLLSTLSVDGDVIEYSTPTKAREIWLEHKYARLPFDQLIAAEDSTFFTDRGAARRHGCWPTTCC